MKVLFMLGLIGALSISSTFAQEHSLSQVSTTTHKEAALTQEPEKQVDFDTLYQKAEAKLADRLAVLNGVLNKFSAEISKKKDAQNYLNSLALDLHRLPTQALLRVSLANNLLELETSVNRERQANPTSSRALGDATELVFTPINPCRFVDTRYATAGALLAGTTRAFYNFNASGQGAPSACNFSTPGIVSGSPGALALTVGVVYPGTSGWVTLSPYNQSTNTSVVNFAAGQTIANSTVVKTAGLAGQPDIQVTSPVATVHLTLDLLGFYLPNTPTALDCINGPTTYASAQTILNNGGVGVGVAACPVGYTQVAVSCYSSPYALTMNSVTQSACYFSNVSGASYTITSSSLSTYPRCCRVPGSTGGRF